MCCTSCVLAQLWTKTMTSPNSRRRLTCVLVALFLFIGGMLPRPERCREYASSVNPTARDRVMEDCMNMQKVELFVAVAGLFILILVRNKIRERDRIPGD